DIEAHLAAVGVAIFQAVETMATLETRKARLLSRLQAAKERAEGLVQTAQHLLHTRRVQLPQRVRASMALVAKVRPLLRMRDALASLPVGIDALLQRGIVQVASLPEQEVQRAILCMGGIEAVLVRAYHRLPPLVRSDVALHRG